MGSSIRDQPLDQSLAESAPEVARGEPAALQLIRHERAVAMQDAEMLQSLQRVSTHLSRREAQLVPDRLGEMGGDAGADALEHQVLHLRGGPSGDHLRERLAQLLAVGEMARFVPQVHSQDGRQQRLARLGHERRQQRGRVPLEHHLPDQHLHLRRRARLDRVQRRLELPCGWVQHAGLLREVPLQGEKVLCFLLRHQRQDLAVGGPLLGGEHQHLRDQMLAAALAHQQIREVETGFTKDERVPLRRAHRPELPQAGGEEALPGENLAFRVHFQVPGQLLEGPGVAQGRVQEGGDAIHAGTACSDTATVVPRPGSLSTRTVPCWAATSSCTMERPSPVPEPGGLVVKNGSKMRERFSLLIPQPLSITESSTRSPLLTAAIRTSPFSGFTACTALWTMFRITWKRSCGLARTTSPSTCWTMRTPFGVCGAIIFTASGTTSESLTEADESELCLRPKRRSCRVTAVIRSTLSSMSTSNGPAPSSGSRLRKRARLPRRKWMGLFISCATPAIIRPSATIFSLCTSVVSAFFSCSSASRSCRAWARRRKWSSIRACSSCMSNGLWT